MVRAHHSFTIMLTANVYTICREARTVITDREIGEIICGNCGMVFSDKIQETRQERRAFNAEDLKDKIRIGLPTSLARHDMGLPTVIGRNNKDAIDRRPYAFKNGKAE